MTRTDYTSAYLPHVTFTDAQLQANRQGILTPDQTQMIEAAYAVRQRGARQTYRLFAIWIPLLLILGFVIEYQRSSKSFAEFVPATLPVMVMVGGFLALLLGAVWVFSNTIARDARTKRISAAEGVAQVVEKEARSRGSHYMRYEVTLQKGAFSTQRFRFGNHSSIAYFADGKTYRVYFIKYYPFPLVLSVEAI